MQQLILNIEEKRYLLLLQFLKTLDYVKIVQAAPVQEGATKEEKPQPNQLLLLKKQLEQISTPLFQNVTDPVAWQKQQRDEWS